MFGRTNDAVPALPGRQTGLADAGGSLPADGLVEFALRVARGSTAERVAFHAGYRSVAVDPGIDRVEVITELRRLVLLAETRAGTGEAWRDAREAADALEPYRGRLTVEARVRFHPQNGYTTVPRLDMQLASASTMQPALDVYVAPVMAPAADADERPAIVGAEVESTFATPMFRGVHTLVVHVANVYLLLATIDLTRMA